MTIKFNITNRWTREVQFTAEIDCSDDEAISVKLGLSVKWAIETGADLRGANLGGANLRGANLGGADLSGAYLRDANLSDANLRGADLSGADLSDANLSDANLRGANLRGANLGGADLRGAYLRDANLSDADLRGANLGGAYLRDANLRDAYLRDADLRDAKGADFAIARTRILPDGDLIGWKKCRSNVIVKLSIPASAKRSHAFGRKCRAEFADVLEVIGATVGISQHDEKTEYRTGARVTADKWDENWQEECAGGIHFYITRIEAENH